MSRGESAPIRWDYLDGMRALAVLSVIFFHLKASFVPAGLLGVDVFFVISGFVVTHSLTTINAKSGLGFVGIFYSRRLKRLLPALLVAVILGSLISVMFMPRVNGTTIESTSKAAILGFSNYVLANTNDYFSPSAEFNTFTHTWSLAVEAQFYLVYPIIFLLFYTPFRSEKTLAFGIILATAMSLFFGLRPSSAVFANPFYSTLLRFWELASGALTYLLISQSKSFIFFRQPSWLITKGREALSLFGLTLIIISFWLTAPTSVPLPGAILPVLGSVLCILGTHPGRTNSIASRALEFPLVVWTGRISYSLYLWHWIVFVVFRWTVGLQTPVQMVAAVAAAFGCAASSYYFIEQPAQNSRFKSPFIVLPAMVLACWGTVVLVGALFTNHAHLSLSREFNDDVNFVPWAVGTEESGNCRIATNYDPSGGGGAFAKLDLLNSCDVGDAKQTMFVVGDSHAGAYRKLLGQYALQAGVNIHMYEIRNCGFLKMQDMPSCEAVIADILEHSKPGDIVFTPSLRLPRYRDAYDVEARDTSTEMALRLGKEKDELKTASVDLDKLLQAGLTVLIEAPKPLFPTPIFRCLDWFNVSNPSCSSGYEMDRSTLLSFRQPVMDFISKLQTSHSNLKVWDPFHVLCPDTKCSMLRDNKPLYFDGDHLTGFANDVLYPDFWATLDELNAAAPSAQ